MALWLQPADVCGGPVTGVDVSVRSWAELERVELPGVCVADKDNKK